MRKGRLKVVMCPISGPKSGHPGCKSCHWGRFPPRRYGVPARMHVANGEGCCPPLCGADTEQ